MTLDQNDPRGLIRESYRIEGIDMAQCRSIFMDWALGTEDPSSAKTQMQALLDHYGPENPDHPMTEVLREGASRGVAEANGRRSGRRRR